MTRPAIFKVALISFTLFTTQSFAAKENFDRSKPHKASIDKPCDIKKPACKKAMKEKMMKKKRAQVKPQNRATDYNSSRSNKADGAKQKLDNTNVKLKKAKTRATDYNSSRSNRGEIAKPNPELQEKLNKAKTKAVNYNSSRSNKRGVKDVEKPAESSSKKKDGN